MSQSPLNFLNLFIEPPGDLLYFLVVIVVSQAGLFMALGQRMRSPYDRTPQRYALALFGTVIAWVVLLAGALLGLITNQESSYILPPLERAATIVTILLLGWAFITADRLRWQRSSNIALLVLALITVAGYGYSALSWLDSAASIDFNLSYFGLAWSFVAVVFSALGLIITLVLFNTVWDAPLKMVFFLVLILGYGGTLYQTLQGDLIGNYSGSSRLAFAVSLLIALSLIYRMVIYRLQAATTESAVITGARPPIPSVQTRPTKPPVTRMEAGLSPVENQSVQLLKLLGLIVEAKTPDEIPRQVVRAALDVLKADVGALLRFQDANYADLTETYDRVMKRPLRALSLNLDNQPTLVNAVERQAQRSLYPDRNAEELQDLYTRLDIDHSGPVYFQPLLREQELIAVLMIALPYARRELLSSEIELLKAVGIVASKLLALSYAAKEASAIAEERAIQAMVVGVSPENLEASDILAARQELQQSLALAREQISRLSQQVMELKLQLDDERTRLASALGDTESGLSISQRIISLTAEQQRLREERDRLARQVKDAEATLTTATSTSDQTIVNNLVESLKNEKEQLQAEKKRLQQQLDDLRASDRITLPQEFSFIIKGMIQESSILESERNQLSDQLDDRMKQLNTLGIDVGVSGLTQFIAQLYAERKRLQSTLDKLSTERDVLLNEREWFVDNIDQVKEFENRIEALKKEIEHLATDRETAEKQRDKLRQDNEVLLEKLNAVKEHRTRLMAQNSGFESELKEAHEVQNDLRSKIEQLVRERNKFTSQYDRLKVELETLQYERDQLLAQQEGDKRRTEELASAGVHSLKQMIDKLTDERNQLEQELTGTRHKLAQVENQIDQKTLSTNGHDEQHYQPNNPDLLLGLVQELRTPMTSISGYVNLLLSESAGIIGEMQRKFLQRVAANISRLAVMIDDLVRVTELDTGQFQLEQELIDIVSLIEDSITNATNQFREKGLTIDLIIDDQLPPLPADRDALNQIIGQLLTNAYLVSPPETEIVVTAQRQIIPLVRNEGKQDVDSFFFSIEDRGGGIQPEDIPRVFARKYKAENPLIDGLGDTGVGLSIAKALIEEHGGQLWVDSKPGIGSVFSFALPLDSVSTTKE